MTNKLFQKLETALIGKIQLQPFYESLHRISIRGMNYMQSQEITKTGEVFAMTYAFSKKPSERPILLDVGANVGQFSSEMIKIFKNDFLLLSFEPSKVAFENLKAQFNGFDHILVYNLGLGSEKKQMRLYNSGSLFGSSYPLTALGSDELIEIERLDTFCEQHGIEEIFYLKIDVEGSEFDVLMGANKLIQNKKIKFIQFEYGPNSIEAKVFLKNFFSILSNYRIYRIMKNGLRLIKRYDEIIEIPLTSNFLAELN